MKDNVAIPYLLQVLEAGDRSLAPIVVYGFRRIGTPEAANALIEVWSEALDEELKDRAWDDLRTWRGHTTDEAIIRLLDKAGVEPWTGPEIFHATDLD